MAAGTETVQAPHALGHATYFQDLAQRLMHAGHGEKREIIECAQQFLGISTAQVYRALRAAGWHSGRQLRTDKGDGVWTLEHAHAVGNLMVQSRRENDKQLLSAARAMDIAHANGLIPCTVAEATAHRLMRLYGVHPAQLGAPRASQDQRSLHPNHVWQIDASICVLFYLPDGGMRLMDEKRFYKNKPQNIERVSRDRVIRYVAVDHTSGALCVRYYLGAGESQELLFDFLMHAFSRKAHPQEILHGVPWLLVWDLGSANTSHLIQHLLRHLRVTCIAHATGNSRAKGSVEKGQDIVERNFEGGLYLMPVHDLDTLNAAAGIWQRAFNATAIHTRHRQTRYGLWQTIRPEQLRLCPARAICEQFLSTRPVERTVADNLTVSFVVKGCGSLTYRVGHVPNVRPREKLLLTVNPYRAPHVDVLVTNADGTEALIECVPLEFDNNGFAADAATIGDGIKRPADTVADRARKDADLAAWGSADLKEIDRQRDQRAPAFGGKVDPVGYLEQRIEKVVFLPRAGTELPIERPRDLTLAPLSITEAVLALRGRLGTDAPADLYTRLAAYYPDGEIPAADLDTLAAEATGTVPAAPRLAVVK